VIPVIYTYLARGGHRVPQDAEEADEPELRLAGE
jgi:hypothetical protein